MEKDAPYGSICKEGSRPLYLADKIDDGNLGHKQEAHLPEFLPELPRWPEDKER